MSIKIFGFLKLVTVKALKTHGDVVMNERKKTLKPIHINRNGFRKEAIA